jgi:hypothetical protein
MMRKKKNTTTTLEINFKIFHPLRSIALVNPPLKGGFFYPLPFYIYVSIDSGMKCITFKKNLATASSLRILHYNYKI